MYLTPLQSTLIEAYQRDLPLVPRPFAAMGEALGAGEAAVLEALDDLATRGVLSRVGPVFRPGVLGASTLAAMAVPPARLEAVAAAVSARPEVNHNYQREHRYNLWFVVTAADRPAVTRALWEIRQATGLAVLDLPLEAEYHIDLGFSLEQAAAPGRRRRAPAPRHWRCCPAQEALLGAVQQGLPRVPRPFAARGGRAGQEEGEVLHWLRRWQADGVLARCGLVVRHHELGYRANAMVVWDVPDDRVDALGEAFAAVPWVHLCYRRPRRVPHWPYNLFCMVHGRDRQRVGAQVAELAAGDGAGLPHAVLFSTRRFKQRGAWYRPARGVA